MRNTRRAFLQAAAAAPALNLSLRAAGAAAAFSKPPDDARPWVYWFWKNGNVNGEGITADLEAMARAGIGGFILMEVSLTTPKGPVTFFSPAWRALFRHALSESARLGLQVSVSSAPGWTGSGGPWVKPETSMQKITSSETRIRGPRRFNGILPLPETVRGFYAPVGVLAFPAPPRPARIENIDEKALYRRGPYSSQPKIRAAFDIPAAYAAAGREEVIPRQEIIDLSSRMDASGRLDWDVPEGEWVVARYGRTSTGQTNRPSPLEGLECDKLEKSALEEHFREFTAKLVQDAGPLAGKTLVSTHLDSWEVGAQNWSSGFRREFMRRRGYDPLPWLPAMSGWVIESREITERFLWDLRQTVSDVIAENHGRHMRKLARDLGLWLSIEPYDMNPGDDMTLGAAADVPMCEFWCGTFDARYSVREATSVAHVYGRRLVGAEAFTSGAEDTWKLHPARVKKFGDWAFSEGVNKIVMHRFVHQPFPQIRPGLTLASHGLHCDRTQTWWELSKGWHTYLARCQQVLRLGNWVSDILYLSPEGAPNVFQPPRPAPAGFKYDACTPEALLTLAAAQNGRIVFPSGAEYRLLLLPATGAMTPELLAKISHLAQGGVKVVGEPALQSPGLSGYPACDEKVRALAAELRGKVIAGAEYQPVSMEGEPMLEAKRVGPSRRFSRSFPVDGRAALAELRLSADHPVDVLLNGAALKPARLEMMLDRPGPQGFREVLVYHLKRWLRRGSNVLEVTAAEAAELAAVLRLRVPGAAESLILTDASWGAAEIGALGIAPFLSPQQKDLYAPAEPVEALLRQMGVSPDFECDRPLRFAHRRAEDAEYYFVSNGERRAVVTECTFRTAGPAPELWHPETGEVRALPEYRHSAGRTSIPLRFEAEESYFIVFRKGARTAGGGRNFPSIAPIARIGGPWQVEFDPRWGGPGPVVFDKLDDWVSRPEEGIRYYSGTAIYRTTFEQPAGAAARLLVDLGVVREFAEVLVNGRHCGTGWRRPFRFDVTQALKQGQNQLEIRVTNLWPNRMIGDEQKPEDAAWVKNRLPRWPQWLLDGEPSPSGRFTFTHIRPYRKDSPLLSSGLFGPVRLVASR